MLEGLKVAIYLLCFATSAACSGLLARGYLANRTRLLFWSALCFGFLAVNSAAVIVDILILPGTDLSAMRHFASLAAVSLLLVGLVMDSE
jgi:hypothetical protein